MLSEGGIPGAGSPLSASSWLFGSTCSFQQTLVTSPEGHVWSEGVEHWREWEDWAGRGHRSHPACLPLPWPTFMAGLALQAPS